MEYLNAPVCGMLMHISVLETAQFNLYVGQIAAILKKLNAVVINYWLSKCSCGNKVPLEQ